MSFTGHRVVQCYYLLWEHNWAAVNILCQAVILITGGKTTVAAFPSCSHVLLKQLLYLGIHCLLSLV